VSALIRLTDIDPNPYRRLGKEGYTLTEAKVDQLMASFGRTTFWENVAVRVHPDQPGRYQQAYGHHRVEALRRKGIEEARFPVLVLTDEEMLKAMADENGDLFNLDVASDITALHSLLEGWASGTIDGYAAPSKVGGPKHEFSHHGARTLQYTEAMVEEFFGWGGRRREAAIGGLEVIVEAGVPDSVFVGIGARKANAIIEMARQAKREARSRTDLPEKPFVKKVVLAASRRAHETKGHGVSPNQPTGEADVLKAGEEVIDAVRLPKYKRAPTPQDYLKSLKVDLDAAAKGLKALRELLEAHPEMRTKVLTHRPFALTIQEGVKALRRELDAFIAVAGEEPVVHVGTAKAVPAPTTITK
jgi:hypothetical protein